MTDNSGTVVESATAKASTMEKETRVMCITTTVDGDTTRITCATTTSDTVIESSIKSHTTEETEETTYGTTITTCISKSSSILK